MRRITFLLVIAISALTAMCTKDNGEVSFTKEDFSNPPIHYRPRPLYFWNNTTVSADVLTDQMQKLRDECGYGGFGVVPFGKNFSPEYLSEDYLRLYGTMLEKAKELGMTISLYDEFGFPSGSAGAFEEGDGTPRFQMKYPEYTIQRLDKVEYDVNGPKVYTSKAPRGKTDGCCGDGNRRDAKDRP